MTRRPEDDGTFSLALKATGAAGVAFTALALLGWNARAGGSVALGAITAWLNLWALARIIRALLVVDEGTPTSADEAASDAPPKGDEPPATGGKTLAWSAFAFVKLTVLFGGLYLLLDRKIADPIALAVGYGALPLGIAASGLLSSLRPSRR